ncbi:4Fe-4S dicluster domain-containing protein [Microbulbifer sp. OS29]|uniref:4Fe-4S dicluster domain-containing protein n=1 Tax=Microbulbifer okhotskensis TaxID=2926617 RepID=A0A9X2EUI1_9GAMM|nr:4Fe-4S dicluster domain-containing protein [Microbulbifer okhotskensis]MCO1336113.1 4Fe-4S dicluster domain-containing protein [Microbulbifer okhotskensis]
MESLKLRAEHLEVLIHAIRADGYQLYGPLLDNGAITYGEIGTASDLPQGWTDEQEGGQYRLKRRADKAYFGYAVGPHSWKQYLQLPRRPVWKASNSGGDLQILEIEEAPVKLAFLGVRSCELHGIAIQDRVFSQGNYSNESYTRRRAELFTIALECTTAADTCFCMSMNTGPYVRLPSDLILTEVVNSDTHFLLIRSGSPEGEAILKQLPTEIATKTDLKQAIEAVDQTAQKMRSGPRNFDSSDLKELLYRNYDSPIWDKVAERCLSCANCTMACPTCFCSTVEDSTDLTGTKAERWERWDSCFTADLSHLSGGPVRADTRTQYRQWMTHKLATWYDQFDSSGCVGCGRCITWCPVGIDITEEVQNIRAQEKP